MKILLDRKRNDNDLFLSFIEKEMFPITITKNTNRFKDGEIILVTKPLFNQIVFYDCDSLQYLLEVDLKENYNNINFNNYLIRYTDLSKTQNSENFILILRNMKYNDLYTNNIWFYLTKSIYEDKKIIEYELNRENKDLRIMLEFGDIPNNFIIPSSSNIYINLSFTDFTNKLISIFNKKIKKK